MPPFVLCIACFDELTAELLHAHKLSSGNQQELMDSTGPGLKQMHTADETHGELC